MNEVTTQINNTKKRPPAKGKFMKEPERYYHLYKNVEADTVKDIIDGIIKVNIYDDEKQKNNKSFERKPIEIMVNSYGGSMYDGFALAGVIDTSTTPVHTICYGKAMSMGLLIFASGHKRFAHSLATFMYHEGLGTAGGSLTDIKAKAEVLNSLVRKYDNFLVDRTDMKLDKLKKIRKSKEDWYLDAVQAKKYGLVDEIFKSRVVINREEKKGKNKNAFSQYV